MNVMTADDTRKLLNVLLDIGDIDVVRSSLEQDFGGCEGKGRLATPGCGTPRKGVGQISCGPLGSRGWVGEPAS